MEKSKSMELANEILERALSGVGPMSSVNALANEYLNDLRFSSNEERIDSLINWEISKNFTSGFVTSLGGFLTLPIGIPAAMAASWVLQVRMAGAISILKGHNPNSDRVKTMMLLAVIGDSSKEVLKGVAVNITSQTLKSVIKKMPASLLREINKAVGYRLITKAGEKSVVSLMKLVPIAGGLVSGTIDAASCRAVGRVAQSIF